MGTPESPNADWAAFYLAHREGLGAYARSLSPNAADAQDLVQDVLVRMVQDRRPTHGAKPLVFRAMRNLAIDRQRRRTRETETLPRIQTRFEMPVQSDDAAWFDSLRSALDRLNDAQREVIVLRNYAGLTFEEIVEATGRPLGTVTSQYARGIDSLRTAFNSERNHVST